MNKAADFNLDAEVYIVNYEKFSRNTGTMSEIQAAIVLQQFDCIVLDEAQAIKSRNSTTSKNIRKCALHIPGRLALTGTPADDKAVDVWAILNFLDPKRFSSYWNFCNEYLLWDTVWTPNGPKKIPGPPKNAAVWSALLHKYAIQHKRAEVMNWDTTVEPIDIVVEPTKLMRAQLKSLQETFQSEDYVCQGVLDRVTRYRQVCLIPTAQASLDDCPKLKWTSDYIREHPTESVIVFCTFKGPLQFILSLLSDVPTGLITGNVPIERRQKLVDAFQAGAIRVLFIQTETGATGLTLDRADTTIFLDVFPPVSTYLQAKDRAVPTDATRCHPQSLYRLAVNGTFDVKIRDAIDERKSVNAVINDFSTFK